MNDNGLVNYVYYLKLFAIFLVVVGHTNTAFSGLIYSFHMPLFFFIAGYFLKLDDFRNVVNVNIKKLLVPYIIFSVLSIFLTIIKNAVLGREEFLLHDAFFGLVNGMSLTYLKSYGFVLWFLLALFFARIISIYLLRKMSAIKILIILFLLGYLIRYYYLPFCISQGILASFWVVLGYIYFNKIKAKLNNRWASTIILLAGLLLYIQIPNVNIAELKIDNYYYYILYNMALLFSLDIMFSFSNNIKVPILIELGKATMFILIVHPYTNNIGYVFSNEKSILTIIISCILLYGSLLIFNAIKTRVRITL